MLAVRRSLQEPMGLTAGIEITLSNVPAVSKTLAVLQSAGWRFWESVIRYEHFLDPGDIGSYLEAPPEDWGQISRELDERSGDGETVGVILQWQEEDGDALFLFRSNEQIHVILNSVDHRLCGRFTDYTWYLSRIVCPLDEARYCILQVTCSDDNY